MPIFQVYSFSAVKVCLFKRFSCYQTNPARYKNSVFLLHAGIHCIEVVAKKMCSIFPVIFTQYSRFWLCTWAKKQKKKSFLGDLLCTFLICLRQQPIKKKRMRSSYFILNAFSSVISTCETCKFVKFAKKETLQVVWCSTHCGKRLFLFINQILL